MSPKAKKDVPDCPFTRLVGCAMQGRNCGSCGWNPRVEKYRRLDAKKRIKKALEEEK